LNKHTVRSRISENPYFFGLYAVLLAAGCIILLMIEKGDGNIFFNNWRGSNWDYFFKFFSSLGEGGYFAGLLLIIGVFSFKYIVTGVSVYLGSGAVTQILKNMFNMPRPKVFFEGTDLVTYVKDFDLYSWQAFPSGHSTGGFAIFLFLALITKNKKLGSVYLVCAFFVGMSRVYLVQHFLIDVYFGSMIGVFMTIVIYNLFENSDKVTNAEWYNFSLFSKINSLLKKPEVK